MKKIVFVFLCLLLLFTSAFPSPTFAGTNAEQNVSIGCLHDVPGTVDTISLPYHDPPKDGWVTKHLTGKFKPGSTVLAMVCGAGQGDTCTTGNDNLDNYLFKTTGLTNNVTFDGQGYIGGKPYGQIPGADGIVYFDATITGFESMTGTNPNTYSFRAAELTDPVPVGNGDVGNDGSQKQATFAFVFTSGDLSDCAQINWTHYDPYGVVFDAQSLEPLPGVVTTILDSTHNKIANTQFFNNDNRTGTNGIYNYGVEPGVYYMTVTPPNGYEFKASPPLNKNAQLVYNYTDSIGVHCTIYSPNEAIPETINTPDEISRNAPDPECRNIALSPLASITPYIAPNVMGSYMVIPSNTDYVFSGKVSHPFTYIKLLQDGIEMTGLKDSAGNTANQIADNTGDYNFKVASTFFKQDAKLTYLFEKANLTGTIKTHSSLLSPFDKFFSFILLKLFHYDVNALSTSSNSIDLPPKYIEGYAYDAQQNIVPNAIVGLRIKGANKDYYQTTADAKGYFYISPDHFPPMEFTIEIVSPTTQKRTSYLTYEFARANKEYFTKNNINLLTGTRYGKLIIQKKIDPFDFGKSQNEGATAEGRTGGVAKNTSNLPRPSGISKQLPAPAPLNPAIVTVLILIFLIMVAGGIAAWVLIKKKNGQTLPPPPMY